MGRPPNKPVVLYYSLQYQAGSWTTARRVVRSYIGAKAVSQARYVTSWMVEAAVPQRSFREILGRIGRVRVPEAVRG